MCLQMLILRNSSGSRYERQWAFLAKARGFMVHVVD